MTTLELMKMPLNDFLEFSKNMMTDWANDDINLLSWRAATAETNFEKSESFNFL